MSSLVDIDYETRVITFEAQVQVPQGTESRNLSTEVEVGSKSHLAAEGYLARILQQGFIKVTEDDETYLLNISYIREVSNVNYGPVAK